MRCEACGCDGASCAAEVERLKEAFDTVADQLCGSETKLRQLEKLNQMTDERVVLELKAEIEGLKKDLENQTRLAGSYLAKLFACQALITELSDALDEHTDFEFRNEVDGLIQRAREATK